MERESTLGKKAPDGVEAGIVRDIYTEKRTFFMCPAS